MKVAHARDQVVKGPQGEILRVLDRLNQHFSAHGFNAPSPADHSMVRFLALDSVARSALIQNFERYLEILVAEGESAAGDSARLESNRLRRAVRQLGLRFLDQRILQQIDDGDVVEIYDSTGRQIYRNLQFCRLSSYSLLDVAVNTWQELYERPMSSVETILLRVADVFSTPALNVPFAMEPHLVKERFVYSKKQKVFRATMKNLSPLAGPDDDRRVAAISVSRFEVVSNDGPQIDFI
ncbi:MAG: hypothetical protein C5B49_08385 [Bdellovibrio sp.]|nr:MAG: hypothetical protein C5B49_08385 [Bdellovibrio sp.]